MRGFSAPAPGGAAALWTLSAAILLLAPLPPIFQRLTEAPGAGLPLDKLVHVGLFAAVASAWLRAAAPRASAAAMATAAAAVAYGGALELLQPVISARTAEWGDLAADAAGALLALGWARRRRASL